MVREKQQQKEPDLWMIKAGFVGSKDMAAEASKQGNKVAKAPLQKDRSKQTRMDDWHKFVQAEGADSPKDAQTEGAQPEGAGTPEDGLFLQGMHSKQFHPNNETKGPSQRNSMSGTLRRMK
jgi:hypothetical protein